jgi:hypothetical protein
MVEVTASNLRGTVTEVLNIPIDVQDVHYKELEPGGLPAHIDAMVVDAAKRKAWDELYV